MITLAHQEHPDLPIAQLCALIGVSKSWYYEHLNQLDSQREDMLYVIRLNASFWSFLGMDIDELLMHYRVKGGP